LHGREEGVSISFLNKRGQKSHCTLFPTTKYTLTICLRTRDWAS